MDGMNLWINRGLLTLVGAALVGCGGGGSGTDGQGSSSGGDSEAGTTMSSQASTSTSGVSESSTPTTGHVSHSGSDTGDTGEPTATGDTTAQATATDSGPSTGDTAPDTSSGDTTPDTSSGDTSGGDTSTGDTGDDTGGSTEPGCIPETEVCNDIDDDCDGKIDNVDVGKDGICDCLNIALVGNQGANPSAEFQNWLIDQGTKVDRIHTNPAEVLDKATISKYDIIILDYMVRNYTPDEAATMKTWVEAGGGLMAMTGFTNQQFVADRPNTLIKPMGLSYNTSKGFFSGPVKTFAPHPITEGLTSISFFGGLYVDIVEDGVGKNEVIMTLPQGPVGVVQDRMNGRLFIFGDEWIEFDSEWKNIPEIKKFWVQTLAWLGPKNSCAVPQ